MGGFVLNHEHKWLGSVTIFFEPMESFVSYDVCAVAFNLIATFRIVEVGIVVHALTRKDIPVVESRWFGAQVPFANDGRFVTRFLKELGEGLLAAIKF